MSTSSDLRISRPGRLSYAEGLALQERLVEARRAGEVPDTLLLLEHDPVVTLGRAADPSHVLVDRRGLASRGIELCETGRGGDVTLHSPGQVVGYPILALEGSRRDAHLYLRDLEEVMIRAARDFGVVSTRTGGLTGIWVGNDKLGAIGVRIGSGWITSHGFALNVSNDLGLYDLIVPCGIRGHGVTSLSRETGRTIDAALAADRLAARFTELFLANPERPSRRGASRNAVERRDRPLDWVPASRAIAGPGAGSRGLPTGGDGTGDPGGAPGVGGEEAPGRESREYAGTLRAGTGRGAWSDTAPGESARTGTTRAHSLAAASGDGT